MRVNHREVRTERAVPLPRASWSSLGGNVCGLLSKHPSALPPVFVPLGDEEPVFLTCDSFQKCIKFSGRDRVGECRRMLSP